ncbi:2-oxoacid:acceptor oxidoreductase family protein [Desulfosudis oleivorans]|uniref:Pyruvate/ketoisovalerate oxidoreductase, gamma subunit n=1 Tax=Desulfosudis oleivorans (strain DSM 6200 / JCM 39069 / Hxd3) TaxID=96561 RepID=A8ZYU3_DESOH|nr:2-oxoacid:acceptor oxidoreductase family protein [Desulfosudis oleivorans]ABW67198.1 pyruvate/ketoisovalerate oxidoreductase, gamma subunit [Desulfosudis oleivorans Hxd3]
MKPSDMDIRWHGRGGQGAITAAKIVANVAFASGYRGVAMIPTFGTERRGAPVFTSLKLSTKDIYDLSPLEQPDVIVILDEHLIAEANVTGGIKPGGTIIINTHKPVSAYVFDNVTTAVADVSEIAVEVGMPRAIVNTGIIGAFARATGLVEIEPLLAAIEKEFDGKRARRNAEAARLAYERTIIGV